MRTCFKDAVKVALRRKFYEIFFIYSRIGKRDNKANISLKNIGEK